MTIVDAVRSVMKKNSSPLTHRQICQMIIDADLYQFRTKARVSAIKTALERHSEGTTRRDAATQKFFRKTGPANYQLLE
jgi:hypothetical protein